MKLRVSRSFCWLLLALTLTFLAPGCGETANTPPAPTGGESTTRTIVDMCGNKVEIPTPENIERVAVLTSPWFSSCMWWGRKTSCVP